jgi:hypothetical protein
MTNNELLNSENTKLMEEYANKRTATIGYFILSIAVIMILGIALCVSKSEKNLLKKHYETRNKINYL